MIRTILICSGLLLGCSASAQRTIGLSLNGAYRTVDKNVLLFGGGASATQPVGKRIYLFVSATGYLAHTDEGTYVSGGPRSLATGDTTSANHRYSTRTNLFMLVFGLQGYTHRRHLDHGLCWLANVGIGADRARYIDDVTPIYSAQPYHVDETAFYPFIALGGGLGYTFPMRGSDFTCSLIDNWAFPFEQRHPDPTSAAEHHSAILSLSYRWGI